MDKITSSHRCIQSSFTPFLLALVFTGAFYALYFSVGTRGEIQSVGVRDFVSTYALYIPAALGATLVLKGYILFGLTALLKLRFAIARLIAYWLIYGTLLAVGVQLAYFEPRNTDVAVFIIDYYAMPLLVASVVAVVVSLVCYAIKRS